MVTTLRLYSGATRPAEMISLAPSSIVMSSSTISDSVDIHQEAGGRVRRARHEHRDQRIAVLVQLGVDLGLLLAGDEDQRPDALARIFDQADLLNMSLLLRQHGLENLLQRPVDAAHQRHAVEQLLAVARRSSGRRSWR